MENFRQTESQNFVDTSNHSGRLRPKETPETRFIKKRCKRKRKNICEFLI